MPLTRDPVRPRWPSAWPAGALLWPILFGVWAAAAR
jgi:hypothetical protein